MVKSFDHCQERVKCGDFNAQDARFREYRLSKNNIDGLTFHTQDAC